MPNENEIVTKSGPGEKYLKLNTLKEFEQFVHKLAHQGKRLICITGVDLGDEIELIYHFERGNGTLLHLRFRVNPHVTHISLQELFPSAWTYENEIVEQFGIKIKGIEGKLLLGKDLEGKNPLRKKFNIEQITLQDKNGSTKTVK